MLYRIYTISCFTVLEARRSHLIWVVSFIVLVSVMLGLFVQALAITETTQFQSSLVGAMLRLAAVAVMGLYVITRLSQEFSNKTIEFILAMQLTRSEYVVGKLAGYFVLAGVIASVFSLSLMMYVPGFQLLVWGISLWGELSIVVAFSVFCVIVFTQTYLALLAVLAFYLVSRMMTSILLLATAPLAATGEFSQSVLAPLMAVLDYAIPNLDQFAQSQWLVYHSATWQDIGTTVIVSVGYVLLFLAVTLCDFYRKNF